MRKGRFTEEQLVTILREADERPVPEVAKKHGISAQTVYAWRKRFGTLEPVNVRRLPDRVLGDREQMGGLEVARTAPGLNPRKIPTSFHKSLAPTVGPPRGGSRVANTPCTRGESLVRAPRVISPRSGSMALAHACQRRLALATVHTDQRPGVRHWLSRSLWWRVRLLGPRTISARFRHDSTGSSMARMAANCGGIPVRRYWPAGGPTSQKCATSRGRQSRTAASRAFASKPAASTALTPDRVLLTAMFP